METVAGFENSPLVRKLGLKKAQLYLTGITLLILYAFYLFQNLFFVNGLNDFDEYFIRAEMWVNHEWNWGGGPDKLLSFIEYATISLFQHDFMMFYRTTNIIIVTLLFIATAIFVLKENEILPNFTVKLFASVFFLTMPFFIFKNLTIDASALFGTMLIFFLVSYNNRYMGWLGLLIYLTRPAGVIIIFFYVLFLIIDKKKRKNILINFGTYIILLVVYKYIISKYVLGSFAITGDAAIDSSSIAYVEQGFFQIILQAIKSIVYIPVYIFLFGMEILQNKILFFFYLLGLLTAIFNKKMYIFYAYLGGYTFLYLALNHFHNPFELKDAFHVFSGKMEWINRTIEIANGRNMEFNMYGHTRYRVFFYPAIAMFVITGLLFIIKLISSAFVNNEQKVETPIKGKRLKKGTYQKVESPVQNTSKWNELKKLLLIDNLTSRHFSALSIGTVLFVFLNLIAYAGFSKPFRFKNQMEDVYMNDYYKSGFEIRKRMKKNDIVFMPNICNCNRAFIGEFLIFSGTRYTLIPVCENCNDHLVTGHPDNKPQITAAEIEKIIPSRNVFFDRYAIDYKKTFNDSTVRRIKKLYQKFDLDMLDSLNIHFVITPQELSKPGLNLVKEVGEVKLYENLRFNK